MGPLGPAHPRGQIEAATTSFQWSGESSQLWVSKRYSFKTPLGTINVIFAVPGKTGSCPSRIMSVARLSSRDINQDTKRARVELPLVMSFSDEDKIRTIQPHDDALMITLRIGEYDVKRVMVD